MVRKIFISVLMLTICIISYSNTTDYVGIDVSHYQGNIDWDKVSKNKRIQFVYIKATEGSTYIDSNFDFNVSSALKAGLNVGVYHYFSTKSSPEKQFEHFQEVTSKYKTQLIPMLDIEIVLTKSYNKKAAVRDIKIFSELVKKEYGVYPIIYGTQRSYNTVCSPYFNDYILYIGRYGNKEPEIIIKNGISKTLYTIWQYSETGIIDGIPKPVDLCRFNRNSSVQDIML